MPYSSNSPSFSYHHTKNFMFIIDQYWKNKDPVLPDDALLWITDGSRTDSGTGSGIYGRRPEKISSFPLGKYATVFQTEVLPFSNVHVKT
jgi:hypothetical protein